MAIANWPDFLRLAGLSQVLGIEIHERTAGRCERRGLEVCCAPNPRTPPTNIPLIPRSGMRGAGGSLS